MQIREASKEDLPALLALYTELHDNPLPAIDDTVTKLWREILADANHHIIVGVENGCIISSCVLIIIPNLTHGQRPYALIENVITAAAYRSLGHASRILAYAKSLAEQNRCYKIMLMTSAKEESTLQFYRRAGYNQTDKTAFIQWLT